MKKRWIALLLVLLLTPATPVMAMPVLLAPPATDAPTAQYASTCEMSCNGNVYNVVSDLYFTFDEVVNTNGDTEAIFTFTLDIPGSEYKYERMFRFRDDDFRTPTLNKTVTATNNMLFYLPISEENRVLISSFGREGFKSEVFRNNPSIGTMTYTIQQVEPDLYVIRGEMGEATVTGSSRIPAALPKTIEHAYTRFEVYFGFANGQVYYIDQNGLAIITDTRKPIFATPTPVPTSTPEPVAKLHIGSEPGALPVISTSRAANTCTLQVNTKTRELELLDLDLISNPEWYEGKRFLRLRFGKYVTSSRSDFDLYLDFLLDDPAAPACEEKTVRIACGYIYTYASLSLDDRKPIGYTISASQYRYENTTLKYRITQTGSDTYELIGTAYSPACDNWYDNLGGPILFQAGFHATFGWVNGQLVRGMAE